MKKLPPQIQKKDPTLVMSEEYSLLPVAKSGFKGEIPRVRGLLPCHNFLAWEERKLFPHNLGHAVSAYLGYLKGYTYIWEAIKDPEILEKVKGALREAGRAVVKKHKLSPQEEEEHEEDLLKRFSNQALGDTVFRVGRDPLRKLGSEERLVGGAKLALGWRVVPEEISLGIAACILYDYPEDKQARKLSLLRREKGIDFILQKVCGLDPGGNRNSG